MPAVETDFLGAAGIALASMAHGHVDSPKATGSPSSTALLTGGKDYPEGRFLARVILPGQSLRGIRPL
jgi:hypothetical protein